MLVCRCCEPVGLSAEPTCVIRVFYVDKVMIQTTYTGTSNRLRFANLVDSVRCLDNLDLGLFTARVYDECDKGGIVSMRVFVRDRDWLKATVPGLRNCERLTVLMSWSAKPGMKELGLASTQKFFCSVSPLAVGAISVIGLPSHVPV